MIREGYPHDETDTSRTDGDVVSQDWMGIMGVFHGMNGDEQWDIS